MDDPEMPYEEPRFEVTPTHVLSVNGGSSSIKFALFNAGSTLQLVLEGSIERIGLSGTRFAIKGLKASDRFSRSLKTERWHDAVGILLDWLEVRLGHGGSAAVGHRIVHGGPRYSEAQRITAELLSDLRRLESFDPEHLPSEILLAEAFGSRFPGLPQVACFDTAFHRDLPRVAHLLPLPRRYFARGIRRYGFHGLSYSFLLEHMERVAGTQAARGRIIFAHLGNGASLAAVRGGRPMDTTMGFTPASGIPMSTRSGDIDPGLVLYMARVAGLNPVQFNEMVNAESGMLGVSETSSDMRDLLVREKEDERAADAVALFCYQVKKCVGAFAAALGGLDTLVFAGGIGENSPDVRARICEGMEFLGIELDPRLNAVNEGVISSHAGRVTVRVMHTDEQWMIAKTVCRILGIRVTEEDYHEKV